MKKIKLSDLWKEVDSALTGDKSASFRFAIVEAHKILEQTLKSKGYPGKSIKKRLYWAGYSLEDREGIKDALEKHEEILNDFDYQLSDFEAENIVKEYKKVVQEIVSKKKLGPKDKVRIFLRVYLHPKSIYFWRNFLLLFGGFALIKVLAYTELGKSLVELVVYLSDLAFSSVTIVILLVILAVILGVSSYRSGKTGIKIKE